MIAAGKLDKARGSVVNGTGGPARDAAMLSFYLEPAPDELAHWFAEMILVKRSMDEARKLNKLVPNVVPGHGTRVLFATRRAGEEGEPGEGGEDAPGGAQQDTGGPKPPSPEQDA